MKLLKLVLPLALGVGAVWGQPAVTNVANAASNLPQGLPNSGIAQGSIFIVQGTGLGPSTLTFAQSGFQSQNAGGSSISITVNNVTVNALMYYASATQLAALLPSGTQTGSGTLTVTYNGSASSTFTVQVVSNNIGVFSFSQDGEGLTIATYPDYSLVSAVPGTGTLADTCTPGQAPLYCPDTYTGAARPGDVITLWATGLGAVTGGDSTNSLGQTNSIAMTLWIGGVSVPITYQGRSGCCIGEDQINFTMPSGAGSGQPGAIPGGCAVPVVLQIGDLVSNTTVMPITASGRSCTPLNPALTSSAVQALTTATGPFIYGSAQMGRELVSASAGLVFSDYAELAFGQVSETYNNIIANTQPLVLSSFDVPPPGTCLTYNYGLTGNPALITYLGGANAGQINLVGPSGPVSLIDHGGTPSLYYPTSLGSEAPYFSLGSYSVTGGGGPDVGSFAIQFNIMQSPTWQNSDQNRLETSTVTRANGMTINWTQGSSDYNVLITGSSFTDDTGQTGAAFACLVPSTLETFTVPAIAMLALPGTPYTEVDFKPALPAQSFSASGMALGIMNFAYQTSVVGVQFQ